MLSEKQLLNQLNVAFRFYSPTEKNITNKQLDGSLVDLCKNKPCSPNELICEICNDLQVNQTPYLSFIDKPINELFTSIRYSVPYIDPRSYVPDPLNRLRMGIRNPRHRAYSTGRSLGISNTAKLAVDNAMMRCESWVTRANVREAARIVSEINPERYFYLDVKTSHIAIYGVLDYLVKDRSKANVDSRLNDLVRAVSHELDTPYRIFRMNHSATEGNVMVVFLPKNDKLPKSGTKDNFFEIKSKDFENSLHNLKLGLWHTNDSYMVTYETNGDVRGRCFI